MKAAVLFLVLLFITACGPVAGYPTAMQMQAKVGRSIVRVEVPLWGKGTGFYVKAASGATVIVTNAHVCSDTVRGLRVVGQKMAESIRSLPRHTSPNRDLCVIKTSPRPELELPLAKQETDISEPVYVVGHPAGMALTAEIGQVMGLRTIQVEYPEAFCKNGGILQQSFFGSSCIKDFYALGVSNKIIGGNSGGPLLNVRGEVTGVVFAGGNGMGFALRLEDLRKYLLKF